MKVSFISLFSAIIIIFSEKRFIKSQSCSYNNCFECISCQATDYTIRYCTCLWTNNQCTYNSSRTVDISSNIYDKCQDTNSLEIQKNYCGERILANTDKKVVIKSNKYNNKYSFPYLFCEYLFVAKNAQKKNSYEINVNRKSYSYTDLYINFVFLHINNSYSSHISFINNRKKEIENIKEIYVHVYFYKELTNIPFEITIKKTSNIGLYIIMAFGILIGLFLIVAIILCIRNCFKKSLSFEEELRNMIQEAERNLHDRVSAMQGEERSEYNEQEETIEDHKKKINFLFKTDLKPKIYTKKIDVNKVEKCTICLMNFKPKKSKVSITSCNHIFHFKCLHKWLYENLISPKCPNCNQLILENLDNNIKKVSTLNENNRNTTNGNRINILPTNPAPTNERLQVSQATVNSDIHMSNEAVNIRRFSNGRARNQVSNEDMSEESSNNNNENVKEEVND